MASTKIVLLVAALLLMANCANSRILSETTSTKSFNRALLAAKDPTKISSGLGAKGKGNGYGKIGGEWQVEEPEAPVVTEPEAPVVTEPEAPVVTEPEAPVIIEPEAPVVTEP